jgi:hypothetical protein
MKKLLLPLALAAAPLAAQSFELSLFGAQQEYKDLSFSQGSTTVTGKVQSNPVYLARVGWSLIDWGPVMFQLTAGYQPESKATYTATFANSPYHGNGTVAGDYKYSAYTVGAMFNFKLFLAFGAGLEYRSEGLNNGLTSATWGRPWARANIGFAFPTPLVKPFIGIEAAMPLTTVTNDVHTSEDLLKSNAPTLQVGVYVGLRF